MRWITFLAALAFSCAVMAVGNDSPEECDGADVTGRKESTYTAPAGEVVECLCIKTGGDLFDGSSHSGMLCEDGDYGLGEINIGGGEREEAACFSIAGLGTSSSEVSELGCISGGFSHADINTSVIPGDDDDDGGDDDDDDDGEPPCRDCASPPHVIYTLHDAGKAVLILLVAGVGIGAIVYRR